MHGFWGTGFNPDQSHFFVGLQEHQKFFVKYDGENVERSMVYVAAVEEEIAGHGGLGLGRS